MENNFCSKCFIFLGVHPDRTLTKLRITFNILLTICFISLSFTKYYTDKVLGNFEPICGLIIVTVQYLTFACRRKIIKRILEAMKRFWNVDVIDDEITFLIKYLNGVEILYKNVLVFAVLTHAVVPFLSKSTSIFNCYIPPHTPLPLFYVAELYTITVAGFVYSSFSTIICFLIVSVTMQFRLVNLRIKDLNVKEIESDHDMEVYVWKLKKIIRHQQFVMRCVNELNKLLSVPVALLIITSVCIVCITTYNITVHEKTISEKGRMFVIISSVITELFVVYGLPGQSLIDQSTATADVIYSECKWYLPKLQLLRNDFLFMMIRSQKGVCLRAGNYHVLNNRTPLLMLKTAYSFYSFLQNAV